MTTRAQLENLAVEFRLLGPNLGHVSVLNTMEAVGLAFSYGLFRAIPEHHRRKRQRQADLIACYLEQKAKEQSL